jgi:non-ribosomal peptide synthetase component F
LRKICDLQILSSQDQKLIREINCHAPIVVKSTIHGEFDKIAFSQPRAPAIDSWDGHFTYEEVRELAIRLACYLIDHGVRPETFVPICMDKSAIATISMLAIMYAGAAYSPMDPSAPVSRHTEMMEDLTAKIILCTPKYSDRYRGVVKHVVSVEKNFIATLASNSQSSYDLYRAMPNNAAYVLFTSGSTGKPKGVLIEHQAICTSSVGMREALHMKRESRVFQFASYTFDASVLEMFTTLTYGGCVCVPSEEMRVSSTQEFMARFRIQWTFLTPSVASLLDPAAVPDLEVLVCGGEV